MLAVRKVVLGLLLSSDADHITNQGEAEGQWCVKWCVTWYNLRPMISRPPCTKRSHYAAVLKALFSTPPSKT
jgi:hypothetical protein